MKRFLALALSFVCLIACVSGAGCKTGPSSEQKENALIIEYYKAGYGELWIKNLAAEYTKRTGTEIVLTARSGNEGVSNMSSNLKSGTSDTDLFFTTNPSFDDVYRGAALANGVQYDCWYEDLTDLYDSTIEGENITVKDKMFDDFEQYYKMPDDGNKYSNKYYFFPWVTGMNGIVVNMTKWNEVLGESREFPRTTDELIAICAEVKGQIAPMIYSLGDEYFTSFLPLFMNQYEGNENMDKFYQGYGANGERYDQGMVEYDGFLEALKFFEELLKPANGYTHSQSASLTFMQMQGQFLQGAALMNINGDWLEREMITNYPNANIQMMKTPVLSAVINKCATVNDDATLRAVIDYVDGKAETAPAGVSADDIAYIAEARNMQLVTGNNTIAQIPCYANQKEKAKDFLRFMASDDGMKIFRESTNGCELPFNYTNPVPNTNVTTFRKSVNEALENSVARFVNNKDKIYTAGGISIYLYNNNYGRFVKAFTDTGITASQYFEAEVNKVNSMLNDARNQAKV